MNLLLMAELANIMGGEVGGVGKQNIIVWGKMF
jgi:hypothetical protein